MLIPRTSFYDPALLLVVDQGTQEGKEFRCCILLPFIFKTGKLLSRWVDRKQVARHIDAYKRIRILFWKQCDIMDILIRLF